MVSLIVVWTAIFLGIVGGSCLDCDFCDFFDFYDFTLAIANQGNHHNQKNHSSDNCHAGLFFGGDEGAGSFVFVGLHVVARVLQQGKEQALLFRQYFRVHGA